FPNAASHVLSSCPSRLSPALIFLVPELHRPALVHVCDKNSHDGRPCSGYRGLAVRSVRWVTVMSPWLAATVPHAHSAIWLGHRWRVVRLCREEMVRTTCNSMSKAGIPLCGLLALVVSACGGGGGTAPPPKPLTVTAEI